MKNRFLFVFMLLLFSVGAAVAQTPKHWTLANHPAAWDALNMTATMVINVDGVELSDPNIEMAAFIGETLMSEGELPIVQSSGRYLYFMTLNGFATPANGNFHNRLKFKLYDHSTDTELEYVNPVEIMYSTNWVLGSTSNPFVVSFFTNEDELSWTKVSGAELKSGDIVVIAGSESDYIISREKGSVGGAYDIERDGNTITFAEPTSAANWNKKAPQKFVIYKDAVANANNAVALFAHSGYLRTPEVDPDDELDFNEFDLWPSLSITSTQPELNAYWSVTTDGGISNIVAIGDNPYSTMQFDEDEEEFVCYPGADAEALCLYRLGLPGEEPEAYTIDVTIEPEGAGEVVITPEQETYGPDDNVSIWASPVDGYQLVSLEVNGEIVDMPYVLEGVTENLNVVATFEPAAYEITVGEMEHGSVVPSVTSATEGTEVSLTVIPEDGYQLATLTYAYGNYVVDIDPETLTFVMPGEAVTINATFEALEAVANLMFDGQSEPEDVEFNGCTYSVIISTDTPDATIYYTLDGTDPTEESLTAESTANWTQINVVVFDGSQTEYTQKTLKAIAMKEGYSNSEILSATYTYNPYFDVYVGTNSNGGGSISASATKAYEGDLITVTPTTNVGFVLNRVELSYYVCSGEIDFVGDYYVIDITESLQFEMPACAGSVEVIAYFDEQQVNVTVTVEPEDAGTVEGAGSYQAGSEVNLVATPNTGYVFVNYTVNHQEIEMPYIVTEDVEIVAHFEPQTFEVTVVANPSYVANVTGSGTYNYGEEITPTYNLYNPGFEFVNWTIDGEPIELPYTVTEAVEIVANFQRIYYTVEVVVDPEEAGTATLVEEGPFTLGDAVTLTYTENPGYEFVNFTVNGQPIELPYNVMGNTVIVANFQPQTFEVTVVANPSYVASVTGTGTYNYGEEITPTYDLYNPGYEFVNWTVDGEPIELPYTVTEAVEIVANFQQLTYTVEVVVDPEEAGTAALVEEGPFVLGDAITLTYTENPGYEFVNFTVNDEPIELPYTVMGNTVIVANFEQIYYEISVDVVPAEGGEAEIVGDDTFYGAELTLVATPNEGWNFVNWTLNDEVVSEDAEYNITVTGDADYVANFAQIDYNIVVEAGEGGEATITDGPYHFGDEVTVTAVANDGYNFLNWTVNGQEVSTELVYTFIVSEDMTLVANFAEAIIPMYTITAVANPVEGGTITGAGTVLEGAEVVLTATAAVGYLFENWTFGGEIVGEEATYTFEATAETEGEYVANFTQIEYNVTIEATEGGTAMIVDAPEVYHYGDVIELAYEAEDGYRFVNFTVNEEEITSPYTVTGDALIMANFELIPVVPEYTVTIEVNPAEAGTVEGAGTFEEGTEVTLTATAADGYEFVNFIVGEEEILDNPYTFTLTEDVTVVANFAEVVPPTEYTVTVEVNPAEAGTVEGAGTFEEGTEVTLTATAADGYEFFNFLVGNEVILDNPYTFTLTEDVTVVANFNEIPVVPTYNITVEEVEHGTISAPATAEAEEIITVTTSADPMYSLVALYYTIDGTNEIVDIDLETKQFVMPAADITIGGAFQLMEGHGDVNLDGYINVVDIVAVFNYILEKDPQPFDFGQADMNEDGVIDVSDAMAINALILGLKADCEDTEVTYEIKDGQLFVDAEVALAAYQFRLSAEPASINVAGFSTMGNWSNGEYILVVYNLGGEMEAGIYSVLDLGDAILNSIVMSTKEGCRVRGNEGIVSVASFDENRYSVYPVPANSQVTVAGPEMTSIEVFNMMGQKVMTINANSDETVVNVSMLTAGSYLFRINTVNGATVKNVVVVR